MYFISWIECNFITIKDLRYINGNIDENYIYVRLNCKANFLCELYQMKWALQKFRGNIINTNPVINTTYVLVTQPSSKHYYRLMMKTK